MTIRLSHQILATAAAVAVLTSCGGSNSSATTDADIDAIEQVMDSRGGVTASATSIDSLALMADDLTPVEATEVLMTYMAIADNPDTRQKVRLETMRKYVDVYDIVMSVNGKEMRPVFEKSAARWPQYNIMEKAKAYRDELSSYAEGSAASEEVAPVAPADTTARDSVQ